MITYLNWLILVIFLVLQASPVHAKEKKKGNDEANPKDGDLAGAMLLLDMGGEKREAVLNFYSACYKALAKGHQNTFAEMVADPEVQRLAKKYGIAHLGGPMLGRVTSEGVEVWLRTIRPAAVEVHLTVNGKDKVYGPVQSTVETDLTVTVPVTGLKPDTTYSYRVFVDGKAIDIPDHAVIRTTPSETAPSKVRIAFGTCFHRWGLGHRPQAEQLVKRQPHALLVGGDIAVQDRLNLFSMHRADYLLRDTHVAWRNIVAAIPVYAHWDDHDYFSNDKAGIPDGYTLEDKQGVCDIFQNNWVNPSSGFNDERRGIFFRTRIGPCDVIMLDNRYFREGSKEEPKAFLGDGQMQWLEEQLLDYKGPFIILSNGTMWSDYVSAGKDSWGKWDQEGRERIFSFIEKNRIGGVLLISGDRHGARGFTIPRPSGFKFYEFEAASMGGRSGPPSGDNPLYFIKDEYAFGEFSIDATLEDPEVTFRLIRDTGEIHHEMTLKRSQLTPPGP